MNRLAGKRALITGGTSGIGLETAQRFIAEGADVLVTGVTPAGIEERRGRPLGTRCRWSRPMRAISMRSAAWRSGCVSTSDKWTWRS